MKALSISGMALLAALWTVAGCKGSQCHSNADCAGGLYCSGPNDPNGCGIGPQEQCAADADCPQGEVCFAVYDPCSPDGIGSGCQTPCSGEVCGEGFRCSAAGACEPLPCDEGFQCPDRQICDTEVAHAGGPIYNRSQGCVDIVCAADSDCPADKACVNGVCQDGLGSCAEAQLVP